MLVVWSCVVGWVVVVVVMGIVCLAVCSSLWLMKQLAKHPISSCLVPPRAKSSRS